MKLKKVVFVLVLIFVARLVVSCCKCKEPSERYYFFDQLIVHNLDNSEEYSFISTSNRIKKEAFGVRVDLVVIKESDDFTPRAINFSSANAMTCDCVYEEFYPKDSIVSLSVFTLNDFDEIYLAESNISAYFKIETDSGFIDIDEYLKRSAEIYYNWIPERISLDLLLFQPPTLNDTHRFKVVITLSDGVTLSAETQPVILE